MCAAQPDGEHLQKLKCQTRERLIKAHLHEPKIDDECVKKEEEAHDVADKAETGNDQGARVQAEPKERFHSWETHSSQKSNFCTYVRLTEHSRSDVHLTVECGSH